MLAVATARFLRAPATTLWLGAVISCSSAPGASAPQGPGGDMDGSAADNNREPSSGNDGGRADGGREASPALEGFDFTLETGDFWEFGWDARTSSYSQGSGGQSSERSGVFRVTLGEPVTVEGVEIHTIELTGNGLDAFVPRWQYLGMDGDRLLGSATGSTVEVIFDADTGYWAGGGFFAPVPEDALVVAEPSRIDNAYLSESAIAVGRSTSQQQCEVIAGQRLCGDEAFDREEFEFYQAGIGPVGYRYMNAYSSSGGGFSSGSSEEYDVGLVASSLRGDHVDYELEREPNNRSIDAQLLVLPAVVKGDSLSEESHGEATEVLMNRSSEIEPNDSSMTAQTIQLPVVLSGRVSTTDEGAPVSIQTNAGVYTTWIEDWFTWYNVPRNIQLSLEYDPASKGDLDLFLWGNGVMYSAQDNPATGDYTEHLMVLALDQTEGPYQVAVDAAATPAGPIDYTLRIDTYVTRSDGASRYENALLLVDWFRVTLASAQTLQISVRGGPGAALMDSTGQTVLAATGPAGAAGTVEITSEELSPGDYLIGVSDEGVPYTLDVRAL